MFKISTLIALLMALMIGTLVSCTGGSPASEMMDPANVGADEAPANDDNGFVGMPAFPFEAEAAVKELSWVSNVDPQTPGLQWHTYNCGVHPDCLVFDATYLPPLTHVPKGPRFAYAIYKIPMGAAASDLLEIKLDGTVEAAGQSYYVALSNWSAMHWEWFGPGTTDYSIDTTTLGYDCASATGDMYLAVVVPYGSVYHLWDITLVFDDSEDPTWWNVWGKAYNFVPPTGAAPTPMPGETVIFEDIVTGTLYTTITAADGAWGFNLPTGNYKFKVTNQDVLFDTAAWMVIEPLEVKLEINMGNVIYHGPNAAYDGNIVGSPIITTNDY